MNRFFGTTLAALGLACGLPVATGADEADPRAVLDKAIKALGGEEKLGKVEAVRWKTKGTVSFGGNENEFTGETTAKGLDHLRSTFEADFGGNPFKGVSVLAGDKGWRAFNDNVMDMDADAVANEKRAVYLQLAPVLPHLLKGEGFKVESAGEDQVDGEPADALKVTGPDGKDFKLYVDRKSGRPVKLVATVVGFQGESFTQETTFGGYKDFGGIQKATRVRSSRDGEPFVDQDVTDFQVLESVPADTFAEPS